MCVENAGVRAIAETVFGKDGGNGGGTHDNNNNDETVTWPPRYRCQRSRNVGFRTQTVPAARSHRAHSIPTLDIRLFFFFCFFLCAVRLSPPSVVRPKTALEDPTRKKLKNTTTLLYFWYTLYIYTETHMIIHGVYSGAGSPGTNFFCFHSGTPPPSRLGGRKTTSRKIK